MPNKSLISVIVSCYNQSEFIAETLDSVLCQTYDSWECIIINDGSTDNSEDIISFCERDSRFKYIYQKNQGIVAARNNAIKQCHGIYILPLDGDDKILEDYLDLAVKVLDENNTIELVYCDVIQFGNTQDTFFYLPELNLRNILQRGCCVSSSVYRKSTFNIIGGYKSEMKNGLEDWEFFISILERGGKVFKLNRVLFKYRINENSRNSKINEEKRKILRGEVVKLHPLLYYEQYSDLLNEYNSLTNSRIYKIALFFKKTYIFFYSLFSHFHFRAS